MYVGNNAAKFHYHGRLILLCEELKRLPNLLVRKNHMISFLSTLDIKIHQPAGGYGVISGPS